MLIFLSDPVQTQTKFGDDRLVRPRTGHRRLVMRNAVSVRDEFQLTLNRQVTIEVADNIR